MQQIVCRFGRSESVRYISHLDLMRALERAMRRADLPVAYTEGFNPRPRVSYASALSVGHTSDAELMAFMLTEPMDPVDVRKALNAALPEGLQIIQAWTTPPHKPRATFGDIDTAEYAVRVEGPLVGMNLPQRAAELMAGPEMWITRVRDKTTREMDLRPLVREISVIHCSDAEAELHMRLRTGSGGGAKPEEVLSALGVTGRQFHVFVHRSAMYASAATGRAARQRLRRMLGEQ